MRQFYVVSIIATRNNVTEHTAAIADALSVYEAFGLAMQACFQTWPREDEWTNHSASCPKLLDEVLAKLHADTTTRTNPTS